MYTTCSYLYMYSLRKWRGWGKCKLIELLLFCGNSTIDCLYTYMYNVLSFFFIVLSSLPTLSLSSPHSQGAIPTDSQIQAHATERYRTSVPQLVMVCKTIKFGNGRQLHT